jgi:hypothetical protein
MKGIAADRLRLAGIALGVAALLVFAPLIIGALRSGEVSIDVAVVNLDSYPQIDDGALSGELDQANLDGIRKLIIIAPDRPPNEPSFVCTKKELPVSCPRLLKARPKAVTVPYGAFPVITLTALTGEAKVTYEGSHVTAVHEGLGSRFGWKPALGTGLIIAIMVAGFLYFAARSVRSRGLFGARAHAFPGSDLKMPAHSVPSSPAAGQQPGRGTASPAVPPRSAPARSTPAQPRPAPPRPGPLPADVVGAIGVGRRVVAQTHFGPQGGYVDVGGVLLWASLETPGEHVYPGRPLSVRTLSPGSDALIVSSRITEEALP